MTDLQERERQRDQQDAFERHVYSKLTYVDGAGSYLRMKGTDTEDDEVTNINLGYGFNLEEDYDTEIFAITGGSDTNQKFAFMSIPFNLQRQWAVGTGGIQNPLDPEKVIEFGPDGVWVKEGVIFAGNDKGVKITVGDGGNITIEAGGTINFVCSEFQHNGVNIGDDHKHTGVEPGGGITGNPVGG